MNITYVKKHLMESRAISFRPPNPKLLHAGIFYSVMLEGRATETSETCGELLRHWQLNMTELNKRELLLVVVMLTAVAGNHNISHCHLNTHRLRKPQH